MNEVIIALDQGSGSSRALAFDSAGRVAARAQFPVRSFRPRSDWVEHDPEEMVRTQELALDAVLSRLPASCGVLGLGLSCQRSTIVLWDARDGKALCPALSWQDGRAADVLPPLLEHRKDIHRRTGLYLTPYYSAPKIRWLLEHDSKVRKAARSGGLRVGPVATYLLWRWTRGAVFAADPTLAQRMLLLDIDAVRWDPLLLEWFLIPREALPALRASTGDWGRVRRGGRDLPVLSVLGDQQAAALGLGCDRDGSAVLNYGTGAFFLLNTGTERNRVKGLLTSVAWQPAGRSCRYFQEGTVHAAGSSLHWLRDNLEVLRDLGKVDALCRRSGQRLLALPAIGGLGAPRWDYDTSAAFAGLNSQTRSEDLVRAVVEAIAYLLADIVSAVREAGVSMKVPVRVSGGLSRIDHLLQFQADLLQLPLVRTAEQEATAAGAAFLAAQGAGLAWSRASGSARSGRRFRPRMPPEQAVRLTRAWRTFVESQQRLSRDLRGLGF